MHTLCRDISLFQDYLVKTNDKGHDCFPFFLINDELIESEESFIFVVNIVIIFSSVKFVNLPNNHGASATTEIFILEDSNDGNVIERLSKYYSNEQILQY